MERTYYRPTDREIQDARQGSNYLFTKAVRVMHQPNAIRHSQNLADLHNAFLKGVFYKYGVPAIDYRNQEFTK